MSDQETKTSSAYLTLEPSFDHNGAFQGFKIAKVTQSPPGTAESPFARVIEIEVEAPREAFGPLRAEMAVPEDPDTVIDIAPADLVDDH